MMMLSRSKDVGVRSKIYFTFFIIRKISITPTSDSQNTSHVIPANYIELSTVSR